jgi:hypothetical protein
MPDVETIKSVSKDVLIPLGSAGAIGMAVFQAWLFVSVKFDRISDVERRLTAVEKAALMNRWTCWDHREFVYELRAANPKLVFPPQKKECE